MAAFQLDLPAYLKRVGLDAAAVASPTAETLAALMLAQSRAHAAATLALLPLPHHSSQPHPRRRAQATRCCAH